MLNKENNINKEVFMSRTTITDKENKRPDGYL